MSTTTKSLKGTNGVSGVGTNGLDLAIDELYATGWAALDSIGCAHHSDGRMYPTVERIKREFKDLGFDMAVRFVQVFDCYRAEWATTASGAPAGAVVGSSELESAIYALARLRQKVKVGAGAT